MTDTRYAAANAGVEELLEALKYVDELGSRTRTRLICVYGLTPQVRIKEETGRHLTDLFVFGRFAQHVEASPLLPRLLAIFDGVGIEIADSTQELGLARMALVVTPRGDAALVLDAEVTGDADMQAVARLLAATCLRREEMRADGLPILAWIREKAMTMDFALPADLALGRDVHQCVFPGGSLLASIRDDGPFWRLVYRVAAPAEPAGLTGIFRPDEVNYPGYIVVGHGRGVSVVAGFAETVENIYALITIMLITGLGVLRRSRANLFEAMTAASASPVTSAADARMLLSDLPAQLNELQLDLEFGVESYLDTVLIPEFIVEIFQRSLCDAMGLRSGLEHSSRMLERLNSVIQARRLALEAATQEQAERRDRLLSVMFALGSLMALPPALLLAYFAEPPGTRIFDFSRHWGAWLIAWIPFILLVLFGWDRRRRIRARSAPPGVHEGARQPRRNIGGLA